MEFQSAQNSRTWPHVRLCAAVAAVLLAATGGCGWLWTSADPRYEWDLLEERCATGRLEEIDGIEPLAGPQEFTVEEALQFTLDNHPRLRARAAEVEVARAALITAGILPNPQFVLDTDTPTSDPGATELATRVMFTIPTGGKRHLAELAGKAAVDEARGAIGTEATLLLTETADAALEVLFLQELITLQESMARLAQEAVDLQRTRIQGGAITPAEALGTEIDAAEIQFDRLNNESKLELARLTLSRTLGLSTPQQVRIRGTLAVAPIESTPLEQLLAEAARVRPDLIHAETSIYKSRRDLDYARSTSIPDFEIGPRYQTEVGGRRNDDSAGLRFNSEVPIWDLKQGDVYEAASMIRVNEALADEVHMTTLHDVAEAWMQIRPIEAALAQYDRMIVPLTERTEALLKDPETAQALDPIDLSDQLRKIMEIRQKRLELQYQHNLIRTKLELLLGRPLGQTAGGAEVIADPPNQAAGPAVPPDQRVQEQGDAEPRRLRPTPAPAEGEGALPSEAPMEAAPEAAPAQPQARKWSPERLSPGQKDNQVVEADGIAPAESDQPERAGVTGPADPAVFLDASNWRPSAKNGGARFRR
jgi:cobalt-zinc-cadmium efflux system outer membrane protein